MNRLRRVVGSTTIFGSVAVIGLPAPASADIDFTNRTGIIDETTSYQGNQTLPNEFRYLSHDYYNNPVTSTLAAVTCGDHVLLGSFQTVNANDHGVRHLTAGRVGPGTCWKVRVRNQTNMTAYRFDGVQENTDYYV